jgi:transposase-like protein
VVFVLCSHCGSEKLVKDGFSPTGKQRYRCRGCGKRSREQPWTGVTPEQEAQVLALANERMSQRGIARALKMSRVTVVSILKKTMS